MTTLPPSLAADLARVRQALHAPLAGPDVLAAREALDRLESSLRGAQALRGATLGLGVKLRDFLNRFGSGRRAEDNLLEAMCDAEERAT